MWWKLNRTQRAEQSSCWSASNPVHIAVQAHLNRERRCWWKGTTGIKHQGLKVNVLSEGTWLLGLWWWGGVHLGVSAEAIQVAFYRLQCVIAALLPCLSTTDDRETRGSCIRAVDMSLKRDRMWRETHLGFDTAEQPQLLFLLLKLPSLPVLLQHLLLLLQTFPKGQQEYRHYGESSSIVWGNGKICLLGFLKEQNTE